MGKFILFSLNLIFLVTYKFFFGGEVLVSQDFPSQIASGETFTIEVTIEKGEREGFAKWQQELPEGFIASAVQTAGATFSFKKNTVKLIWMALPENENFTISYEVRTDPSLNASYELSGKFSYIDENKRRDINCDVKKINIGAGGAALAAKEEPKKEVKKEEIKEETPVVEEKKEVSSGAAVAAVSTPKKEEPKQAKSGVVISNIVATTEDVKVERTINVMTDGSYVVNLVIDKKNYESFGKVEEYIPTGFVASELKNDEGMFSFNNNVMKILWMALPPKSTLEVSYNLKSTSDELDSATVHGVFSFLRGEESVQLAMKGSRFPNNFMMEEEKEEMKVEEPIAAVTPADPEPTKKEQLAKEVTSMPSPETNVSYRVQIAAGKKEVKKGYFTKRHGITEEITTDYHNSWYKYMIGSYGVYKQARDKRNQVWASDNQINDAFVTAYNSGERITVQEALMITKQKWYK